jgi:hypothetical protein
MYTSCILYYFENATFCSNFLMQSLQFNPIDGIAYNGDLKNYYSLFKFYLDLEPVFEIFGLIFILFAVGTINFIAKSAVFYKLYSILNVYYTFTRLVIKNYFREMIADFYWWRYLGVHIMQSFKVSPLNYYFKRGSLIA